MRASEGGKLGQISTDFEVKRRKSARSMGIKHEGSLVEVAATRGKGSDSGKCREPADTAVLAT